MKKIAAGPAGALLLVLMLYSPAPAADVSLGASLEYGWWNLKAAPAPGVDAMAPGCGPNVAVRLTESWSVTGGFLHGTFEIEDGSGPGEIKRLDSEILLHYHYSRLFRLFGGARYSGCSFPGGHRRGYGGEAGAGFSLSLSTRSRALADISGFFIPGESEDAGIKRGFQEAGAHILLALAWEIEPLSAIVTAGYRGRFSYTRVDGGGSAGGYFNGIAFSAMYRFEI